MAVKKESKPKATVKKEKAKVTEKAVSKKSGAKAGVPYEIFVRVPQGGQVIRSFNLTPALPVNGQAGDWLFIDPTATPPKDISLITVSFVGQSTPVEQDFERAILIVNLKQNPATNGHWRFVMNGVTADPTYSDVNHDLDVVIADQGQTLITQVQVVGDSQETIQFGFIASFTDAVSGAVTIYESKDPGIKPKRP